MQNTCVYNSTKLLGTILSGTYKYPFSFDLPAGIPSSFEHINGRVVYEITAEISRGDGRYYRNSKTIQVSVPVDLNDMAHEISMVNYSFTYTIAKYIHVYRIKKKKHLNIN